MRIALFTETFLPKVDGIVTRLRHTVDHLQRDGNQVLVFAPEGGITEHKGAKVYGVSGFPLPLYPELKMSLPRPSIGYELERFQPDIIHVVNPAVLGLSGIFYSKVLKIPLVASYHTHLPKYLEHYGLGMLEGLLWELLKGAHNQAELNLCTSTAMVEELSGHGIERVDLWQRGVDTELFDPDLADPEMRSHLTQNHPESPLLLYVGRLSAEKEIERIKPILEAIPNARLALVGDGPHRQALEKHFAGTNTYFVGYLMGKELGSAFASSDAFIFPSRTETLGLVLLEAMAAGCPVVAARSGGIPDIVTDGVNGYLFDPKADIQEAIDATVCLLQYQQDVNIIRKNARKEAENWGWAAATRQLQDYYHKVVSSKKLTKAF
ncbi:glycosyltransferase family 1 protein [Anabaena cylindrica FACHB-243]|uniref:Glycosyl transferase group 1 n=1 Tax=Anabaena cylindrica (strain ATCC 27899 / PCC 7122) TaxID=272123 RepID=K9ZKP6_ANACC|nr:MULTISPECIES: glycosyltransferase family 1 protein [Anabaena]AFZ59344.1 glycosyl transferase group 1 [Anabaena cylindrica PCC 7122]MBD2416795.1 glycosyltransferase family 1 protein [Anabaena cylindrica FACHB-243]MBY5280271.1 glycosyltransferase family 1 protein [Anabaena sp. CCAP 1446/1C]MBY5310241.1 glycosyltransferase family 1 protein [Anabaena sp. CCAP 1446/1C]MCM2405263.1 glycosyltransferase family 1 protein [Anabaena sp. CCAP 1446/1C]